MGVMSTDATLQICAGSNNKAPGNTEKFREELAPYIKVDQVPRVVETKKAMYKARALEYFRQKQRLTRDDWVLHLDEESQIDESVIKTCLDFIERGHADFGIGTIFYTSANHWRNAFLSAAEVGRLAEDFGQFQLPVRYLNRPLLGWIHGSWILINGEVENTVTWDTDCISEDFWFGYQAASQKFQFDWLHAVVLEQPPFSLDDFWNQRRRWYTGILSIDSILVKIAMVASVAGGLGFWML
ncbi:hypothetical protein N7474_009109 [Penicillium riverlandense]|uniref:uncharacterized protein n=1 Tax=Penicillium riverlandense TaxID=1903569 RepID=UPI002548BF98|nr:uncharacterized protein N7474_009109 [Penicillium riverlandense]KAJ5807840.1 hypothetical protein N7474_009109 [Penicillium riverlandense]